MVLDTNIVISAVLSPKGNPAKIMEQALLGKIHAYHTKELMQELIKVLNRATFGLAKQDITRIITHYTNNSSCVQPQHSTTQVRDRKDNIVLACAKGCKADYNITGDEDLLVLKTLDNTKIVPSRQFLKEEE